VVAILAATTVFGTREAEQSRTRARRIPMLRALAITFSNRHFLYVAGAVFFFQMAYLFTLEFQAYVMIYAMFGGDKARFGDLFLIGTVASLVVAAMVNLWARRLARRTDKKPALVLFTFAGLLIPAAALFAFDADRPLLYLVFAAVSGVGITGFEILSFSVVADICDLDELRSGQRREGAFMGGYNGVYKAGLMLAPVISNLLLHYYCRLDQGLIQAGLAQTPETSFRLRVGLVAVTAVGYGVAGLFAALLPLTRRDVEEAQRELVRRRGEQADAAGPGSG
jgi:GPH family glycoside/pentoside/hexuronide:cation symporter